MGFLLGLLVGLLVGFFLGLAYWLLPLLHKSTKKLRRLSQEVPGSSTELLKYYYSLIQAIQERNDFLTSVLQEKNNGEWDIIEAKALEFYLDSVKLNAIAEKLQSVSTRELVCIYKHVLQKLVATFCSHEILSELDIALKGMILLRKRRGFLRITPLLVSDGYKEECELVLGKMSPMSKCIFRVLSRTNDEDVEVYQKMSTNVARQQCATYSKRQNPETAIWFNAFIQSWFQEYTSKQIFTERLQAKFTTLLAEMKKPSFIESIVVKNLFVDSNSAPVLSSIFNYVTPTGEQCFLFDMAYKGEFAMTIVANVGLGDIATSALLGTTLAFRLSLLEVEKTTIRCLFPARGLDSGYIWIAFDKKPKMKFSIESVDLSNSTASQGTSKRNLPQLTEYVVTELDNFFLQKLVLPSWMRVKMPWYDAALDEAFSQFRLGEEKSFKTLLNQEQTRSRFLSEEWMEYGAEQAGEVMGGVMGGIVGGTMARSVASKVGGQLAKYAAHAVVPAWKVVFHNSDLSSDKQKTTTILSKDNLPTTNNEMKIEQTDGEKPKAAASDTTGLSSSSSFMIKSESPTTTYDIKNLVSAALAAQNNGSSQTACKENDVEGTDCFQTTLETQHRLSGTDKVEFSWTGGVASLKHKLSFRGHGTMTPPGAAPDQDELSVVGAKSDSGIRTPVLDYLSNVVQQIDPSKTLNEVARRLSLSSRGLSVEARMKSSSILYEEANESSSIDDDDCANYEKSIDEGSFNDQTISSVKNGSHSPILGLVSDELRQFDVSKTFREVGRKLLTRNRSADADKEEGDLQSAFQEKDCLSNDHFDSTEMQNKKKEVLSTIAFTATEGGKDDELLHIQPHLAKKKVSINSLFRKAAKKDI